MGRTILIIAVLLISHCGIGQKLNEKFIMGKVIDSKTKQSIPYAQIASYRLTSVFAADSMGRFNILTFNNDSLKIFSIGFKPVLFHVSDSIDEDHIYSIILERQSIVLNSVDVHPWSKETIDANLNLPYGVHLGQESEVPIEVRSEVGGKPPVVAAFFHPISFGYYYLSKRERTKRKLRNTLGKEKIQLMLSNELLSEISGLKGNELQNFRIFCNKNIELSNKDNEQTVRFKVLDALQEYQKEKNKEPHE